MEPNYYNKRGRLNAVLTKEDGKVMREKHPEEYERCIRFSETVTEYKKGKRMLPIPFKFRLQWFLEQNISRCHNCDSVCEPDNKFCSAKCSRSHPDTVKKISKTREQKYGSYHSDKHTADYGFVTEEGRRKAVETKKASGQYLDYEKTKRTMTERYGDVNYNVTRSRESIKEKYGVDNPYQIESVRKRISEEQSKNNSVARHIPKEAYDDQVMFDYLEQHGMEAATKRFNCSYEFIENRSLECGWRERYKPIAEQEMSKFLDDIGILYYSNSRSIIKPYEIDLYIPESNIGIEHDGVYWHSSDNDERCEEIKERLQIKRDLSEQNDITLIHIREDQWKNKNEICRSMLSVIFDHNIEYIDSNECNLVELEPKIATKFMKTNHLHGSDIFDIAYGLVYGNELVSAALVKDNKVVRYCDRIYTKVSKSLYTLLSKIKEPVYLEIDVAFASERVYDYSGIKIDDRYELEDVWVKNNRIILEGNYELGYRKMPILGNKKGYRSSLCI